MSEENAISADVIPAIPAVETQTAITELAINLNKHFLHDGEKWTVDLSNPPSLDSAYQITEVILDFKRKSAIINDQSNWLIGNIVMTCRDYFLDDFDIMQVGDITGTSYNTLITSESVYVFFGDRRVKGMSFSHHKEVHYTKGLTDPQKFRSLELAHKCDLNTKETRKLCGYVRDENPDILVDPYTPLEVINILDEYKKEAEAQYICITYDGVIKKVKQSDLDDDMVSRFGTIIQSSPELKLIKQE